MYVPFSKAFDPFSSGRAMLPVLKYWAAARCCKGVISAKHLNITAGKLLYRQGYQSVEFVTGYIFIQFFTDLFKLSF